MPRLVNNPAQGEMLRITSKKEDSVEVWELEGKLSGELVAELERWWKGSNPQPGVAVKVHLKAVTYVDAAGKALLAEMHRSGVEIKGCGCMTRAVIEEIIARAQISVKKILSIILLGICVRGGI
jgi:ABC-type transporter Mla MlaB component